ncbi:MAG TPA: class I SAM-dependent methyltransferase [Pirellulales bacterium]|nr:class I SAM-dependent methyltransferase [Pirellulales bacterium]
MERLRETLKEPATRTLDVNTSDMTVVHRHVLLNKRMLRRMFEGFYAECRRLDGRLFNGCDGPRLEIGSGSSIIKEFWPDVVTSDIKPLPFVDRVVDAQAMPFADGSLRAIYGINVFHHLPRPRLFFREAIRVLQPGGGVVFIEPYHGVFARWLFPRLHDSEIFDLTADSWENNLQSGPCSGANQALSGIIFDRDRERFLREFPELELVLDRPHTHLSYLLSGGVNFRQLVPGWAGGLAPLLESVLSPLNRWIALQHTIVLRKRRQAGAGQRILLAA